MSSDPGIADLLPATPNQDERNWAMAAHLCGALWLLGGSIIFFPVGALVVFTIVGPLIIWKSKGDTRPFVASQAKEALNFQITVLLLGIVGVMLIPILIGFAVLWALGLVTLIFVIIAAIQVNDGKPYRYPFALRLVK